LSTIAIRLSCRRQGTFSAPFVRRWIVGIIGGRQGRLEERDRVEYLNTRCRDAVPPIGDGEAREGEGVGNLVGGCVWNGLANGRDGAGDVGWRQ
jgi:hypothetical protein